ncbi:MAG: uracil-DNA glycosylase [Hyphomicrobiales bacterium]|nr:uracil-DNA glycosylase [Hyphomicrobiales bacterium]
MHCEATSYRQAFERFLRDARAEGWVRELKLVAACAEAVALADAARSRGDAVLPAPEDVFNAFCLTPLQKVRAVILGQDPYPTPGHAHGLAFSVRAGVKPLPPSLRNIFKELREDLGVAVAGEPLVGDLTAWAEQGVLLLNTALTVEARNAGAHVNWPWREMTKEAILAVNRERHRVVFLLWGLKAQKFACYIDNSRHLILASEHPSPLSANRGFFGSKPFSRANAWLAAHGEGEIDWRVANER